MVLIFSDISSKHSYRSGSIVGEKILTQGTDRPKDNL